jgi:molybdate transport system substrate-binding protein
LSCAALLVVASGATAAELAVLVTGSMADPFESIGEDFTHATGHTLKFSTGTTSGVVAKIRGGERADVVVLAAETAVELENDGTIAAGTRTPVASSVFGVVIRADGPRPDVATADALKRAVTAARSISYPDPVVATVSGGYIEQVFDKLGIKDAARAKAALKPMGYLVGEAVQAGEVDLGLSFISEFIGNERLVVVPFPAELQKQQLYAAGVLAGSEDAALAREFIRFVTSAAARAKLTAAGVVPAGAPAR